jgi:hypothetical protein
MFDRFIAAEFWSLENIFRLISSNMKANQICRFDWLIFLENQWLQHSKLINFNDRYPPPFVFKYQHLLLPHDKK